MGLLSNTLRMGASQPSADTAFQIEKSLRFEKSDSSTLSRTFSSAGNRQKFTVAFWAKLSKLDTYTAIFTAGSDSTNDKFQIYWTENKFRVADGFSSVVMDVKVNRLSRDFSAWAHYVIAVDTTQSISTERVKIYINGKLETSFATTDYPSQNANSNCNNNVIHWVGGVHSSARYFSGYVSDVFFIDGLQLDAAAFGKFNSVGNWDPAEFALPAPNDGSTFSNGVTTDTGSFRTGGHGATTLFDGLFNIACQSSNESVGNWIKFTPASPISFRRGVDVYQHGNTSVDYSWELEDGTLGYKTSGPRTSTTRWDQDVILGSGKLKWLKVTMTAAAEYSESSMIRIDGKILEDGETDQTYTQWAAATSDNVNSFHLKFNNTSDLGEDSLKSNDFTANNLSGTGTSDLDVLNDTPTNYEDGGTAHGNYCTLNPLKNGGLGLSQGNLQQTLSSGATWKTAGGTFGVSSGKWYFEYEVIAGPSSPDDHIVGWAKEDFDTLSGNLWTDNAHSYSSNGWYRYNTGSNIVSLNSYTVGDVIGVAINFDNGNLYFYKNGTAENSGNAVNTTSITGLHYPIVANWSNGDTCTGSLNFGQRAFKYTNAGTNRPAADYKALCTQNLDDTFSGATKNNPSKYFDVLTYTGNGGTLTVKGTDFQPDLVWLKKRSGSGNHTLWDAARGVQERLMPDTNDAEATRTSGVTAFNSDGFTTGNDGTNNDSGATYVSWLWDAGTSAATASTDGSITPSAQWVNTAAGFSISKWTGTGSNATIGHALGAAPDFHIIKRTNSAADWRVFTNPVGPNKTLALQSPAAKFDANGMYQGTLPSSTVVSLSGDANGNASGDTYIMYCWTEIFQFSKFGSWIGNGNADGPFVHLGFRPAMIIYKQTGSDNWTILDSERSLYNGHNPAMEPDSASAEWEDANFRHDFLSNGFKLRSTHAQSNSSGVEYIYAAWAESPLKTARAR